MVETPFRTRIVDRIGDIDAESWNALANPETARFDPFISWEFLEALELSQTVTPETGWLPQHLVLEDNNGVLHGALPQYLKSHSQGEYVFDYVWADAFQRAGGQYYPKLLCATPFTPVSGRRFLTGDGSVNSAKFKAMLLQTSISVAEANHLSSLHVNFVEESEAKYLAEFGMLLRTDQQFHWRNYDYADFNAFLSSLSSSKRKNLRKERAKAQEGLDFLHLTGSDLTEEYWDYFYEFYIDTGARKWGSPYLNRETFSLLGERLSNNTLLILATCYGRPIAGALNFIGSDTLYGRYWGCSEYRSMLHFEVCYYQAIDYALAHKLKYVEAGAQGGHKLARGYEPVTTYSAHWITHPQFRLAVSDFLKRERKAVEHDQAWLSTRTPFKKTGE